MGVGEKRQDRGELSPRDPLPLPLPQEALLSAMPQGRATLAQKRSEEQVPLGQPRAVRHLDPLGGLPVHRAAAQGESAPGTWEECAALHTPLPFPSSRHQKHRTRPFYPLALYGPDGISGRRPVLRSRQAGGDAPAAGSRGAFRWGSEVEAGSAAAGCAGEAGRVGCRAREAR